MLYAIAAMFVVMDCMTGVVKGFKSHSLDSTKMRDGAFKKFGYVLAVALGFLLDYGAIYAGLNFDVSVAACIAVAVIVTESVSIIENIGEINPDMVKVLAPFLNKLNGGKEND